MPEIIKPKVEIEKPYSDGRQILKNIERYGRVCYKSEHGITETSAHKFLKKAIKRGHFSIIEHEKVTAKIICDRGVSHEIVRHRLASYSQESTRYCDYSKEGSLQVVEPLFFSPSSRAYKLWFEAMKRAERSYNDLRKEGIPPEGARLVLPHSLKTEIVVTYNLREWRHFFYLRCARSAHPQIRQIAIKLLEKMKEYIPVIFDDFIIHKKKDIATTDVCPPA